MLRHNAAHAHIAYDDVQHPYASPMPRLVEFGEGIECHSCQVRRVSDFIIMVDKASATKSSNDFCHTGFEIPCVNDVQASGDLPVDIFSAQA